MRRLSLFIFVCDHTADGAAAEPIEVTAEYFFVSLVSGDIVENETQLRGTGDTLADYPSVIRLRKVLDIERTDHEVIILHSHLS